MKYLIISFSLLLCLQARGQEVDIDGELNKLSPFFQALHHFSNNFPQEKVYLHFDNTSYYQGDPVWFKCYIVTSGQHQLSLWSKTLYVELLNPGGEIIDKRILKIENGQCHGGFTLNQLPFYSGFYEVRAYTKYMLNFGEDIIYSRLLPVFDKPKTEGDFAEKKMLSYGRRGAVGIDGAFPMKRESPERGKAVNVRFFPEGGNMVQGIASRVAFEATDEAGNPIEVKGVALDGTKQEICQFATQHEGRGVFTFTPDADKRKPVAVVEYAGRKYQFDLPAGLPKGVVMEVDNLTFSDSIGITLRKNSETPVGLFGIAVVNGGKLKNYCAVPVEKDVISFNLDKTQLPAGVSQVVLFDVNGEIICDRLVFIYRNDDRLVIKAKTDKPVYKPYELVNMEISVTDSDTNPVPTTFSLSVRDGENEVESNHSVLTDLLLMSEIKGYVRNPSYYFETKNDPVETLRTASLQLDILLMVQGWRRYSWKQMAGVEPFELKYLPEQGIETKGNVAHLTFLRKLKPKSNVEVGLLLQKRVESDNRDDTVIDTFVSDSQGRFSFVSDVEGRWSMILSAHERGKPKDYRIMLDRVFTPEPQKYRFADLQVNITEQIQAPNNDLDEYPEEDPDSFFTALQDSLAKLGIDEKIHPLEEVTVTAKRTKEQIIFHNRSTSTAFYDITSELDDFYDSGNFIGDNIHELLMNMNDKFDIRRDRDNREWMLYKSKLVLFVVDYKIVDWSSMDIFRYQNIRVPAIKSIFINESMSAFCDYFYLRAVNCSFAHSYFGCTVLIETKPEEEIPVADGKGVRKTWLEGYSPVREFYSPNYSQLPPEPDYRRTLYWNPAVTPDATGHAKIQFYNNSRSRNFSINAETVTAAGMIGVYKNE
jgi:hypothetical protein